MQVFAFSGRLHRARFLAAAAIRVVLFAATVFGFPFILWGIANASGCRSVGGACGAVALIASMALKPVFFFGFVFSLVGISLRRARDAGLPALLGLGIPLIVLADFNFGLYGGAHWSYAFATGAGRVMFPVFMVIALVAIVGLGSLPSSDPPAPASVADASEAADAAPERPAPADKPWPAALSLPVPPAWIYLLGAASAAGAVIAGQRDLWRGLTGLMLQLMPIGFPTFVIYSVLIYGIWAVIKKRNLASAAVLAVALMPFAAWLYATSSVRGSIAREVSDIKAVQTEKLDHVPRVLVFRSRSVNGYFRLLGMHGITEIIADGPYSMTAGMVSYTGQKNRSGQIDLAKVEKLPSEYLLLKVGSDSSFADRTKRFGAGGGPLELRYVAPGHDDLIAVWYKTFNPVPAFPPVLTTVGWLPAPNDVTTDMVTLTMKNFLDQALSGAATPSPDKNG